MVQNVNKRARLSFSRPFDVIIVFVLAFFILLGFVFAFNSGSSPVGSPTVSMSIWTNGTLDSQNVTYGTLTSKSVSDYEFYFNVNFTNSSQNHIITNSTMNGDNGFCQIKFNQTGVNYDNVSNLTYNSISLLWIYNQSFSNEGNLSYQVQCNSSYGNITLNDNFVVLPTAPWINLSAGKIYTNPSISCPENINSSPCFINLNALPFVWEDDLNDQSKLTFQSLVNTTLGVNTPNVTGTYTLYTNGTLMINTSLILTNGANISKQLEFLVQDPSGGAGAGTIPLLL